MMSPLALEKAVEVITSAKINLEATLVVWSWSLLILSIVSSEQAENKDRAATASTPVILSYLFIIFFRLAN